MADTAVAITAGVGTNIDTRTEATNSNHRQVVVIGDPSVNAGVAPVDVVKGLAVDLTASGALPTVTNLSQMSGAAIAMGTGVRSAGTQRVTVATDDLVPVTGTVTAGLVPVTSGGLTISSTLIAAGTNATSVKASAGQLYKIEVTNNSANIGYLKLYNTAGTPTAGSGTPVIRLMCPGNATGTGAFSTYDNGVAFVTGIGFTFTGGIADADTTSVAASAFIVNLYYK